MYQHASVDEELEAIEQDGQCLFKVKGSEPPVFRILNVDHNVQIQLEDGRKFTLISDHPGAVVEDVDEEEVHPLLRQAAIAQPVDGVIVPGVRFKILS